MFCPLGLKAGKACDLEYGYNIHHVDLWKTFFMFLLTIQGTKFINTNSFCLNCKSLDEKIVFEVFVSIYRFFCVKIQLPWASIQVLQQKNTFSSCKDIT